MFSKLSDSDGLSPPLHISRGCRALLWVQLQAFYQDSVKVELEQLACSTCQWEGLSSPSPLFMEPGTAAHEGAAHIREGSSLLG